MRFDQMDVYTAAIEYVGLTRPLGLRLRRDDAGMADQLQRAVVSVACNVAECAEEFSQGDKKRFYRYALRPATETVALIDASFAIGATKEEERARVRETGMRLIAMLTRLVMVTSERGSRSATVPATSRNVPKPRPGAVMTPHPGPAPTPTPTPTPVPNPVPANVPTPDEAKRSTP